MPSCEGDVCRRGSDWNLKLRKNWRYTEQEARSALKSKFVYLTVTHLQNPTFVSPSVNIRIIVCLLYFPKFEISLCFLFVLDRKHFCSSICSLWLRAINFTFTQQKLGQHTVCWFPFGPSLPSCCRCTLSSIFNLELCLTVALPRMVSWKPTFRLSCYE